MTNNVFLNSKQLKEVLGLTCCKLYNEKEGDKLKEDLMGKFHHYNIVQWNNIDGKMVMNYTQELWKIVDVNAYLGTVIIENNGRFRSLYINDLNL